MNVFTSILISNVTITVLLVDYRNSYTRNATAGYSINFRSYVICSFAIGLPHEVTPLPRNFQSIIAHHSHPTSAERMLAARKFRGSIRPSMFLNCCYYSS